MADTSTPNTFHDVFWSHVEVILRESHCANCIHKALLTIEPYALSEWRSPYVGLVNSHMELFAAYLLATKMCHMWPHETQEQAIEAKERALDFFVMGNDSKPIPMPEITALDEFINSKGEN